MSAALENPACTECTQPRSGYRLWCDACGRLLPAPAGNVTAASLREGELTRDVALYEAVLENLKRLSTQPAGTAEQRAVVRAFFEEQLALHSAELEEARNVDRIGRLIAAMRRQIAARPTQLEFVRARIEAAMRELPGHPLLRDALAEIDAKIAAPARSSPPLPRQVDRPTRQQTAVRAAPRADEAAHRVLLDEDEVPPAAHRVVESASTWSHAFKPFLLDNVGWFVGAFLILAGFGVLVTTFWRNIGESEILMYSLVFFGLFATAGCFLAAAYTMRIRHPDLETSSSVLLVIVAMLVPLVFASAVLTTMARGFAGPLIGTIWGGVALGGLSAASRLALGPFARQFSPSFARSMMAICAVTLAAPLLRGLSPLPFAGTLALTAADYVVTGMLVWGLVQLGDELITGLFVDRRMSAYLVLGSLAHAALVVLACLHFAATSSFASQVVVPAGHYAPLLVILAALVFLVDYKLKEAGRRDRLFSRLTFSAYAVSLIAVAMSFTPLLVRWPIGGAWAAAILQNLACAQTLLLASLVYGALAWYLRSTVPLYLALFALVAEYHVVVVQWVVRSPLGASAWALACLPMFALMLHAHERVAELARKRVQSPESGDIDSLVVPLFRMLTAVGAGLVVILFWQRFATPHGAVWWSLVTCLSYAAYAWSKARTGASAGARYATFALVGSAAMIGVEPAFGATSAVSLAALSLLAVAGALCTNLREEDRRVHFDAALLAAATVCVLGIPSSLVALLPRHGADPELQRLALLLAAPTLALCAAVYRSRLPAYAALAALPLAWPGWIAYGALAAAMLGSSRLWMGDARILATLRRLDPSASGDQVLLFGRFPLPLSDRAPEVYLRPLREVALVVGTVAMLASGLDLAFHTDELRPIVELSLAAGALFVSTSTYRRQWLLDLALAGNLLALHAAADRLLILPAAAGLRWPLHLLLAECVALSVWLAASLRARAESSVESFRVHELRRCALFLAGAALSVLFLQTTLLERGTVQLLAIAVAALVFSSASATGRQELRYLTIVASVLAALNAVTVLGIRSPAVDAAVLAGIALLFSAGSNSLSANGVKDDEATSPVATRRDHAFGWRIALSVSSLVIAVVAVVFGMRVSISQAVTLFLLIAGAAVFFLGARCHAEPLLVYPGGAAVWVAMYFALALTGLSPVDAGPSLTALAFVFWFAGETLRRAAPSEEESSDPLSCSRLATPLLQIAATFSLAAVPHALTAWMPDAWDGPRLPLLGVLSASAVVLALVVRSQALRIARSPESSSSTAQNTTLLCYAAVIAAAGAVHLGIAGLLSFPSSVERLLMASVAVALAAAIAARLVDWQAEWVARVSGVSGRLWRRPLAAWALVSAVACVGFLTARLVADPVALRHTLPAQDALPWAVAAAVSAFVLLQLAALGSAAALQLALAAMTIAGQWACAASDWLMPPDFALGVCGLACALLGAGLFRPGETRSLACLSFAPILAPDAKERAQLDRWAVALLALAAVIALPAQSALHLRWPSAGATFGIVAIGLAVSAAASTGTRRATAAALFVPPAVWCSSAWVTGSDLLHPALPFATLLFALAYLAIAWPGTEGKSWRQHLPELAVLALRRASAVLILAGSVGALLSTMIDSWFVAAALALAAIAWGALAWNPPVGRFASDSAREASVYLAEAALASAYLYVRHGLFGAPFGPNIVTAGAVIAASLVLLAVNVIAARSPGAAPLSRASYRTALALPLALLFVTPRSREATTMSAFSAGAFYMIVAQRSSTRWALYCAALLFNVGLYVWLPAAQAATGLMQLYVIPAATTVLILAQLHRHDLSPPVLARVRTCAAAAILAAATVEVLNAPTMLHFALMLASTLLGIAAGIALRVRVIVLVGVAFLVANVVLQLGLHMRTPTGVMRGLLLITVGLTITAAMVFLNLKRSELLRRYRAFVTDPSWE